MVEQLTLNQWVLGSSPRWCTNFWPVGQAVKTPASHAGNTSSILVRVTKFQVGAYCSEVTPVPIPNTAVKLTRVDDTRLVTARESRSVPALICLLSSVGRASVRDYTKYREVKRANIITNAVKEIYGIG